MKTVNQNLKKAAAWATYGFAAITVFSCNTYQGVTAEEDGIYGNSKTVEESVTPDGKNNYYQQYFSTKAAQIEEIPDEDLVFTDIEAYSSQESMDDEGYVVVEEEYLDDYGSWGSNASEVNVNVYGGWNNGFVGNGWNIGYWYGGWNAGYWGGIRPWGFNYWNNPFWGYSSYWGYNPYWGWGNAYFNPWFNNGFGWGGGFYNPWFYNNHGYAAIANRGRSNQDRFAYRGRATRSSVGTREQSGIRGRQSGDLNRGRTTQSRQSFDLNRGRNSAVRSRTGQSSNRINRAVRSRGNSMVRSRFNPNVRPTQSRPASRPSAQTVAREGASRPNGQNVAPSNAAKNFKIKRRSRPSNNASASRPANAKPVNNKGTKKSFKRQNTTQRSFNRSSFQNSRPMSAPRNYSRPSSGRGSGGRGGRG